MLDMVTVCLAFPCAPPLPPPPLVQAHVRGADAVHLQVDQRLQPVHHPRAGPAAADEGRRHARGDHRRQEALLGAVLIAVLGPVNITLIPLMLGPPRQRGLGQ